MNSKFITSYHDFKEFYPNKIDMIAWASLDHLSGSYNLSGINCLSGSYFFKNYFKTF